MEFSIFSEVYVLEKANLRLVLLRDQSKFTGYLGRVLGKICLKKVFAPLF